MQMETLYTDQTAKFIYVVIILDHNIGLVSCCMIFYGDKIRIVLYGSCVTGPVPYLVIMYAHPVTRVAHLPRIRYLRSTDLCSIAKEIYCSSIRLLQLVSGI